MRMRTRAVTGRGVASLIGRTITAATLCGLAAAGLPAASAASTGASAHSSASSPGAWSRLWWNPDQQGERLLESGDAIGAAQRFRDPQRRAYAELQAGRYTEAARLLAPLKDPESQYNRGNALAHAGQLQAALAAYDAALARAPADRDARHNRDLVARALAQQPQRPQRASQQGSQPASQQGSRPASQKGSQPGSAAGEPTHAGQSGGGQSGGGKSGSDHAGGSQAGAGQSQAGRQQAAARPQPAGAGHPGAGHTAGGNAQTTPRSGAGSQSGAVAGRATSGAAPQAGPREDSRKGAPQGLLAQAQRGSAGEATPRNRPPSEQALSLDQWLRRLPDDPGGLLRRKFLIEHLMRQQDQQQGAQ
jgi:Ca-activated chloride channel homolog